jgi:hypothetical protein
MSAVSSFFYWASIVMVVFVSFAVERLYTVNAICIVHCIPTRTYALLVAFRFAHHVRPANSSIWLTWEPTAAHWKGLRKGL